MLGIMAGQLCALFWQWHVQGSFCWYFCTSRWVPPVVLKPTMPRIMAGMNQRDSYVATFWRTCLLYTTTGACGSDCRKTVDFPQLQSIKFVDISFVTQWHIHTVLATAGAPVAVLERGDRCPWHAGRAGSSLSLPVVCNDPQLQFINMVVYTLSRDRGFPMVQTVRQTIEIPQLPHMWWSMSLFTMRPKNKFERFRGFLALIRRLCSSCRACAPLDAWTPISQRVHTCPEQDVKLLSWRSR